MKTQRNNSTKGVDLNRNADVLFDQQMASTTEQCGAGNEAYTYQGPSADSEAETIARRDYMNQLFTAGGTNDNNDIWIGVDVFMDVHSIGDFYYYPGLSDFKNSELAHLPKEDDCNPGSRTCLPAHREEAQRVWAEDVFSVIEPGNNGRVIDVNFTQNPCFDVNPSQSILSGAGFSGTADMWSYLRGAKYTGTIEMTSSMLGSEYSPYFDSRCLPDHIIEEFNQQYYSNDYFVCNYGTIAYLPANSMYNGHSQERYGDFYNKLSKFETKDGLSMDDLAVSYSPTRLYYNATFRL